MTITAVEVVGLRFPLARPISSALGAYTAVDATGVWLHTSDGTSGFGMSAGLGGHAGAAMVPYIVEELAPLALGADAGSPEGVWRAMWAPNKPRLRGGLGAWALSAVDIACWDVAGKAAGRSVHALLGGDRARMPAYGSGGWLGLTDDELIQECASFVGMGMKAYKYKIGGGRDEERTALLRGEMGDDLILLADANQSMTVDHAIEASAMLAGFGVGWLEEPVLADSTDDLAAVARASSVPVAAGENVYYRWGFREICDRGAARYLQPDVGRCGGITEFAEVGRLADEHGLSLSSHLWPELSAGLVAAYESAYMIEYAELIPKEVFTREFPIVDGEMPVSDVPGHGVELTSEAVTRFATGEVLRCE